MADYIDREAAETAAHKAFCKYDNALQYAEMIHQLSKIPAADVVEVVRCRECRYYDPDDGGCKVNAVSGLTDDDYCSWGEAKDG